MASGSVIGALRVNLGLDSAQFSRGAKGVVAPLTNMKRQFQAVAGVATLMGGAIVAAALAGAREIDGVAKAARRLDASIGGFRALELAAGEAGVNLSGLTNDIQTMNREIASIGVSGNGQRALDALGLSVADLEGLDADEKLATISDRVTSLGLSAGETTAVLRDLGVRNREMALLMLGGGEAIRAARNDVRDYGLEISQVDATRIEVANDAIGRLGLISNYAGQQLALSVVPALGNLAEAMTNSLREGGALRGVIDGLVGNLDFLVNTAGVAVVAFGVRYVGALVAANVATLTFSGALLTLRKALLATGIGALIVGAGLLVTKFGDLVASVGGVGQAFGVLSQVAVEVWDRAGHALDAFGYRFTGSMQAIHAGAVDVWGGILDRVYGAAASMVDVATGIKDAFVASFSALPNALGDLMYSAATAVVGGVEYLINSVIRRVNSFTSSISATLNNLPDWARPDGGFSFGGGINEVSFGGVSNPFAGSAGVASSAQDAFGAAQGQTTFQAPDTSGISAELRAASSVNIGLADVFGGATTAPLQSVEALISATEGAASALGSGSDAAAEYAAALAGVEGAATGGGGSGGAGGASGGAAGAIGSVSSAADDAPSSFQKLVDGVGDFSSAFGDAIVSSGDLSDAVSNVGGVISSTFDKIASEIISSQVNDLILQVVESMSLLSQAQGGGGIVSSLIGGIAGGFSSATGGGGGGLVVPAEISSILPSFSGGGYTGGGSRSGGVDGQGGFGAILHPNETVIDHSKSNQSAFGANTTLTVIINENAVEGATQTSFDPSSNSLTIQMRKQMGTAIESGSLDGALRRRFSLSPSAKGG